MIELGNIIDLNKGNIHFYGQNADEEKSTKIISDNSEFIPICSIPKIICINHLNSHSRRSRNIDIIKAFEEVGIKEEVIDFLREDSIYPELLVDIVLSAIYSIIKSSSDKNLTTRYGYYTYSKVKVLELFDKITKEEFYTLLSYLVIKDKTNLDIDIIDKNINNYLLDGVIGEYGNISSYSNAILAFFKKKSSKKFSIFKTRNPLFKYVIGKYYIAHYNMITGETTPLVCMVAKRKNLPYFKAAQVMDDYVSTDSVELWVKDDFDVVRSAHRGLRPKYRKFIKTPLQEAGVKIVTKPNFNEMLLTYSLPKFKTIVQYEEFLNKASVEVLESINK